MPMTEDLSGYPGGDLVSKGIKDLDDDIMSEEALLVLIAGPRLSALGFDLPPVDETDAPYEHELYARLELRHETGAHAAYNALIRRVVSFANAYAQRTRKAAN